MLSYLYHHLMIRLGMYSICTVRTSLPVFVQRDLVQCRLETINAIVLANQRCAANVQHT